MTDALSSKAEEIAEVFGLEFDPTAEPLNSAEDVRGVERALGVALPDGYRAFLLYVNDALPLTWGELYVMAGRRSLSGARHADPGVESTDPDDGSVMWASDVVRANLELRARPSWLARTKAGDEWWEKQPRWPAHLIQIAHSGSDWSYYLDLSRMDAARECPVVVLPPGPEGEMVAPSFVEFLRMGREAE